MATRKQRKRRQKGRRHEYEYVYVDDEGREVEPPEEVQPGKRTNGKAPEAAVTRGGRKIEPPSWSRVGKRALWIAPLMFLTLTLIAGELTLAQRLSQTALMLGIFLPVSYVMDRTIYRTSVRRKSPPPR
jgi:hypothetical protein